MSEKCQIAKSSQSTQLYCQFENLTFFFQNIPNLFIKFATVSSN